MGDSIIEITDKNYYKHRSYTERIEKKLKANIGIGTHGGQHMGE
jgi:hypothetical protein